LAGEEFKRFVASSDETKWELTNQEAGWRIFQTRSQFRGVGSTPPHISFQMRGAKGVGIVLTQPEQVFQRLMDVGDNRLEWDTTFDRCLVPERVDKFTDIVELAQKEKGIPHKSEIRRVWSRGPDGKFIIIMTTHLHSKVLIDSSNLERHICGGWILSPLKLRRSHRFRLGIVNDPCHATVCLVTKVLVHHQNNPLQQHHHTGVFTKTLLLSAKLDDLRRCCQRSPDQDHRNTFGTFSKDDEPYHKSGPQKCVGTQSLTGSLEKGAWPFLIGYKSSNCWCSPEGNNFRVRGANYLRDGKKIAAGEPIAQLVAVDWFVDFQRIDNVCARPTGTCQKKILADESTDKFVFAVNIQVPGSRHFSIVYYYVLQYPVDEKSLFGRFIHGTNQFRNSRLKLIPNVALGPWVVQRAVGTKPLIVGRALKVTYHSSPKFMEIDIDIGSSTVANNIVRFVLGYVRTLVVDMCFLIEGKDDDELPVRQLRFESKLLLIHVHTFR